MPYMDNASQLRMLLERTGLQPGGRNMPGTGVLQPQYQMPDPTSGWVENLAKPIDMPAMDIAGVPPSPAQTSDVIETRQAAPRVAPLRPSAMKIVPLQKQPEPITPQAQLMKEMERQIGLSNSDKKANMLAARNMGLGMAGIAPQSDLSGLYNYVNAQTGSNFQQAPDQFANRQQLLEKMMSAIPAGQAGIREADMGLLKTKMGLQQAQQEADAKAKESSLDRQLKMKIAQMELAGKQKAAGLDLSPMQKRADFNAAKDYNDFWMQGGHTTLTGAINSLDGAIKMLETRPEGSLSGRTVGTVPQVIRKLTNQDSVDLEQNMNMIAAKGLKALFPGSISDKETEFITKNQYDGTLSHAINLKRMRNIRDRFAKEMEVKKAGAEWFETQKTMKGFPASTYVAGQGSDTISTQQAAPQKNFKDMTDAELDAALAAKGLK